MRTDRCNSNGNKTIVFGNPPTRGQWKTVFLPCGQCIGCRLSRSRDWAMRCVHEASLHPANCYLTLTYDDAHVPWSSVTGEQTLVKKHLQDFLKRLRFHLDKKNVKVRFFACGEYGELTHRPHYHLILFGYDFEDKFFYKLSKDGQPYYISPMLNEIWSHGDCVVAGVTFESCAYVSRYVTKKITGDAAEEVYEGIQPEFVNMSRRPGIGSSWFEKYSTDVYPYDEVIIHGNNGTRRMHPPRYYDKLYEQMPGNSLDAIKEKRIERGERKAWEITQLGRLDAKEKYILEKTKDFKRSGI